MEVEFAAAIKGATPRERRAIARLLRAIAALRAAQQSANAAKNVAK